jgi:hypothetical protein
VDPGVEIPEEATAVHGVTTERARAEMLSTSSSTACAVMEPSSACTISLRRTAIASTLPVPRSSSGEARKRRTIRRRAYGWSYDVNFAALWRRNRRRGRR